MADRTEFKCEHCKKDYSSYKSRWLHIKKYHKTPVVKSSTTVVQPVVENVVKCSKNENKVANNICKYCNKQFCDRMYSKIRRV